MLKVPLRLAWKQAPQPANTLAHIRSAQLHSSGLSLKHVTDTEMNHRNVKYGRSGYPRRPNDARVPANPDFGITNLTLQKQVDSDSSPLDGLAEKQIEKKSSISKAMQVYLERAKKHNRFIEEQEEEFELGRRHLANMMGVNEESMSQDDINLAIKYLMPSGLFDPRARPRMRPPKEIFPAIKEAQFNSDGRPFSSFFYTGRANFYQACFELESEFRRVKEHENSQINTSIPLEETRINDFHTSTWLSHQEMNKLFLERITEAKYESFITALERLVEQPYSRMSRDFLMKFRKEILLASEIADIPPLKYDENNRPYMSALGLGDSFPGDCWLMFWLLGRRKHCVAFVTVRGNGSGKIDINGRDILYFDTIQDREQIMTPLKFCGLLFKVDVECRTMHKEFNLEWSEDAPPFPNGVRELGTTTQSGAIRYALSVALKSFVDPETVEKMRLVGLLSKDQRVKERKKWGQEGARRKYTWKKR